MNNIQPSILETVKETIQQYGFKRLLLAVSGGLDSICLAHFFISNKDVLGIEWIGIAHVHHGLRAGTADRDAEFVRFFADKLSTPFFIKHLDGNALKIAEGSLEENARKARYEALKNIVTEINERSPIKSGMTAGVMSGMTAGGMDSCTPLAILTAHHAGDQAETLYLRLRRGVGLSGLRGIQQIRPFSSEQSDGIQLFRPFLNVTRKELLEYAHENKLNWCEDESNADTAFARNKIRHESLPHLEQQFPNASKQLCHIANLASIAHKKVLTAAQQQFAKAIIPQEQWPFDPKYACFKKVMALDLSTLNSIFSSGSGERTPIKSGIIELFRFWLSEKGFRIPIKENGTPIPYPFLQRFHTKSIIMEKCCNILWICDISSDIVPKNKPDNLYLNTDKFSGLAGQWRYRTKGDMLWPADEKIKARKLEQWLREQGIPQWMFDSLPLFAKESRIFFVEGIRQKQKKV